jgi:2-polyprenyl-3-methyl-5-hydroxy-6-metoxy-1,4-benzoquinol methylase
MCMDAIYNLLQPYSRYPSNTPEYVDKMMHDVPEAKSVSRETFIVELCRGKRVINFGSASGNLHAQIKAVATSIFGVDKDGSADKIVNLDDEFYLLRSMTEADIYVCGEIIEHLANPGRFLDRLHDAMKHDGAKDAVLLVTVPNAFSDVGAHHILRKTEAVNVDHVAWYSYHTLKTLLERSKYLITDFRWYNGKPYIAEGLIFVAGL